MFDESAIQAAALQETDTFATGQSQYDLATAIKRAQQTLLSHQETDGHWLYELEADTTIPSEYIMLMHFVGEIDELLQVKIARYIRSKQSDDGSFPLYYGSAGDISISTKAYFALKLAGDDLDQPHMRKAREYILSQGGVAKANVFTRIALATFGLLPWRGVPYIPVEIMLLPRWFPFHLTKVSYWSRTVMVPLFVICTLKAKAQNPTNVNIDELYKIPADQEYNFFAKNDMLDRVFLLLDRIGKSCDRFIPGIVRQKALKKAEHWIIERLNGEDGIGGIMPAMAGSYQSLLLLGYDQDHEHVKTVKKALEKLLVVRTHDAYCQPCLSPVWDTGLAVLALQQSDMEANRSAINHGIDWLLSKQLSDEPGDWQDMRPNVPGGGWAFQYENPHYPDVDDTAVVGYALQQMNDPKLDEPILRAARWIAGMQSKNGGWGAFDAENTHYALNHIPFADHGALLDPPTVDVSARCIMFLAKLVDQHPEFKPVIERGVQYLRDEQETDGCWFGRWGTNYVYGTWSVLDALGALGMSQDDPMLQAGVQWLLNTQKEDGGWGEDNYSYHDPADRGRFHRSTTFHTAWAILGLLSVGYADSDAVKSGIDFLLRKQEEDGLWDDPCYTAPGFPKVFYLKYHGYNKFFPLWALAEYKNCMST
ncbi:MAG: squalene--hopene cyclase [Gammaproteobacteria bacterium]|nr:squalene--hopene cyclase [Gammaproteobacteria bacterium]